MAMIGAMEDLPPGAARAAARVDARCPLCVGDAGETVWRDARLRVVLADEPEFPGFTRAIWNAHVGETTDLDAACVRRDACRIH